jgi:hypothetical protein
MRRMWITSSVMTEVGKGVGVGSGVGVGLGVIVGVDVVVGVGVIVGVAVGDGEAVQVGVGVGVAGGTMGEGVGLLVGVLEGRSVAAVTSWGAECSSPPAANMMAPMRTKKAMSANPARLRIRPLSVRVEGSELPSTPAMCWISYLPLFGLSRVPRIAAA